MITWLFKAGNDPGKPVWIALHGSGRDEKDVLPWLQAIDPDSGVVAIRGAVPWLEGYAHFARKADGSLNHGEIGSKAQILEAAIVETIAPQIRMQPRLLFGFSNGAIMAAALLLRRKLEFDAAILMRPMLPLVTPVACAAQPQVLILEASNDTRRSPADARDLAIRLRENGACVDHNVASAGHLPTDLELLGAHAWLCERIER